MIFIFCIKVKQFPNMVIGVFLIKSKNKNVNIYNKNIQNLKKNIFYKNTVIDK